MKALITVENGKVFQMDTQAHLLTLLDSLGKPTTTLSLQRNPRVVPGFPFTFTCCDGLETMEGNVVQVIYCQ